MKTIGSKTLAGLVSLLVLAGCSGDANPDPGHGAIEGAVHDAGSGEALEAATLRVGDLEIRSDERGLFRFSAVGKGSRLLSVAHPGFHDHAETVTVLEGETTALVVSLEPRRQARQVAERDLPRVAEPPRSPPRAPKEAPRDRIARREAPIDREPPGGPSESEPSSPGARVEFETVGRYCVSPASTYLCMNSAAGDYIGQGRHLLLTLDTGRFAFGTDSGGAVTVEVEGDEGWHLSFAPPNGEKLVPGLYTGAARYPMHKGRRPGLSISGAGRGCNTLEGRFLVHFVAYSNEGAVEAFAADFEQRCEGRGAPLVGRVVVNVETVPETEWTERRAL